jgi:hypothetical protein
MPLNDELLRSNPNRRTFSKKPRNPLSSNAPLAVNDRPIRLAGLFMELSIDFISYYPYLQLAPNQGQLKSVKTWRVGQDIKATDQPMNSYQIEQLDALQMVQAQLAKLSTAEIADLRSQVNDYLLFRSHVASFSQKHFEAICTRNCFQSELSACCSKDGIIVFFADIVINALVSGKAELDAMAQGIRNPVTAFKCIFLSETGCLWRIKPIVCEMFLCDQAQNAVFTDNPEAKRQWERFLKMKKRFTWPDKPVLFEQLESFFMDAGCDSSLMHIHKSPGLLRIKRQREKS